MHSETPEAWAAVVRETVLIPSNRVMHSEGSAPRLRDADDDAGS